MVLDGCAGGGAGSPLRGSCKVQAGGGETEPSSAEGSCGRRGGTTAVFRDLLTFSGLCVQGLSYLVCLRCYNKLQQTADLKQQTFLIVLEAGSPRTRCQQIQCLVTAHFLACRWLPSGCVSCGFSSVPVPGESEISLSSKGTHPIMRVPPRDLI